MITFSHSDLYSFFFSRTVIKQVRVTKKRKKQRECQILTQDIEFLNPGFYFLMMWFYLVQLNLSSKILRRLWYPARYIISCEELHFHFELWIRSLLLSLISLKYFFWLLTGDSCILFKIQASRLPSYCGDMLQQIFFHWKSAYYDLGGILELIKSILN